MPERNPNDPGAGSQAASAPTPSPEQHNEKAAGKPGGKAKKGGWNWLSWERDVEILKIAVTFYAACIGTFVTFEFNERQHELARIEAIAKMLPHLSEGHAESASVAREKTADAAKQRAAARLASDGAMWAIFRTANNSQMLRDLAALFPEDIYRVVSSIAEAGGLEQDKDAIVALQVSSEKLANRYSFEGKNEIASRLYNQAVRLKEHPKEGRADLSIVDITDQEIEPIGANEHITDMLMSLNKLAGLHKDDSEKADSLSTSRWNAKQMYKRVRQLGLDVKSDKGRMEVAKADLALSNLYIKEKKLATAKFYLHEALALNKLVLGPESPTVSQIERSLQELTVEKPDDGDSATVNGSDTPPPGGASPGPSNDVGGTKAIVDPGSSDIKQDPPASTQDTSDLRRDSSGGNLAPAPGKSDPSGSTADPSTRL